MRSLLIAALLLSLGQQAPPPPPPRPLGPAQPARDASGRPPDVKGTASIRGRVVASDTGSAVRRATLSLIPVSPPPAAVNPGGQSTGAGTTQIAPVQQTVVVNGIATQISTFVNVPGGMGRPQTATTDTQGMFEFKELPAGTYQLRAQPSQFAAQYLGISYGAKKPNGPGSNDPGQPIQLADGQSFTAVIALPKGTVITGHVSDENGDPLARVQVYTILYPPGSTRGQRSGSPSQTDDLGGFRIYGLAVGEYVVVAEGRNNTFVNPNAPPETEEERIGLLTTYFPGTPDEGSAQHIRTRIGGETTGIEIRMATGRLLHITGVVIGSQGAASDARFNGQLWSRGPSGANTTNFGFSVDQQGRFQMRNIPPGDYRLIVRQMNMGRPPNAAPGTPPDMGEFAVMPISLTNDLDDIVVTTAPGATITGQIVYDGTPPAAQMGVDGQSTPTVRVSAQLGDPQNGGMMPTPPPVPVAQDLTFTMKGLMGEMLLRANGPGQYLKAVQDGGEDVTDTPHEFKQGDRVTIVMTTQASTLEGNVTDDKGDPVNAGNLLLFSEDKSMWRMSSIHTRRGGVDITGHFKMTGILPGRYLILALPSERMGALNNGSVDPSVFEQFSKEATSITVSENEQRQVDLKLSAGSGG